MEVEVIAASAPLLTWLFWRLFKAYKIKEVQIARTARIRKRFWEQVKPIVEEGKKEKLTFALPITRITL